MPAISPMPLPMRSASIFSVIRLALYPKDQVHRPFAAAVIDEADSILIDEARIPLVLAGGQPAEATLADRVDQLTRHFKHPLAFYLR